MTEETAYHWEKAAEFHGHKCPGLAIGLKAALFGKTLIGIDDITEDEDTVCLAETDACGVDAVQTVLKATLGSGSLRVIYRGKNAYSFYNRKNNKSVRLVLKKFDKSLPRQEKMKLILEAQGEELFHITNVREPFPERAKIYNSKQCGLCGEETAENAIKEIDGLYYCFDCFKKSEKTI